MTGPAPLPTADAPLESWLKAMYPLAAERMAASISATHLVRHRTAFGQVIVPARGSVLASPAFGFYDPDPDYFFHWLRDSALVMDACTLLLRDGIGGADWAGHFDDFVRFSLGLNRLSGAECLAAGDFRAGVEPDFRRYLRSDAELAAVEGDRVLGETRFNPDGSLDRIHWSRPQFDGPALRALAVLRYCRATQRHPAGRSCTADLLRQDLEFICRYAAEPSYDLWEDVLALHYHTQLVQAAALEDGADWAEAEGDAAAAGRYRTVAQELRRNLDDLWCPERGIYRTFAGPGSLGDGKQPDIAVILAVIQAQRPEGRHSVLDERVQSTLLRLETLFASEYGINRDRPAGVGIAMGRYAEDTYFSGGAYYFSTLAAAEFYYRLAAALPAAGVGDPGRAENRVLAELLRSAGADLRDPRSFTPALAAKGDAFVTMVRRYTPSTGELSEQFDRETGAQSSAKDLAWSYAALISAVHARGALSG